MLIEGIHLLVKCRLFAAMENVWYTQLEEKFEDTKGLIKSRISNNDRQYNGQEKGSKIQTR